MSQYIGATRKILDRQKLATDGEFLTDFVMMNPLITKKMSTPIAPIFSRVPVANRAWNPRR